MCPAPTAAGSVCDGKASQRGSCLARGKVKVTVGAESMSNVFSISAPGQRETEQTWHCVNTGQRLLERLITAFNQVTSVQANTNAN